MERLWQKKSNEEIKKRVFEALSQNINYVEENILGLPASYLDDKIFSQDAAFLKDAPFMSTLIQNPNHIGCHTLGKSESFFAGTQEIEKEVIEICAVDILKGEPGGQDGYVASGGTEANIQAIWIYRNYFIAKHNASRDEICILCSSDSHYSMDKGANLLSIDIFKAAVDQDTRTISSATINTAIDQAQSEGKKYFIVVGNMMTTMFGSVDHIDWYSDALNERALPFKMHVDGAYGGFYYPFTKGETRLNFSNPNVSSITLDAHKMAQAPYGTGIFLIRKGLIHYANTKEASYVEGEDFTLIGSRSGANAIAIWMILVKNGPFGWEEKIFILQKRTEWVCEQLKAMNVDFFRHPKSNIITIKSECIKSETAQKYGLVPDNHHAPKWYKVVIMEHVIIEKLLPLIEEMKQVDLVNQ